MYHLPLIISDIQSLWSLYPDSFLFQSVLICSMKFVFYFSCLVKHNFSHAATDALCGQTSFYSCSPSAKGCLHEDFGFLFLMGTQQGETYVCHPSSCHFPWGFNFSSVHLFVKHHWIRAWRDCSVLEGVWEHRHDFSHPSDPTWIQPCCPMTGARKQQGVRGKE